MKDVKILEDLKNFLDQSPTAWHAVQQTIKRLKQCGFIELKESESWKIKTNQAYFIQRNHSSLCAFITPKSSLEKIRLIASHTDSPALKLKPFSEIRQNEMILFGVEVYGGPLLNSWLNRDLGLAGKVIIQDEDGHLHEKIVELYDHPFVIPQLAIHLDREITEKGLLLNKQTHLNVLAALDHSTLLNDSYLEKLLRNKLSFKTLIDHELFFVPLEKAQFLGFNQEMLAAYRIDSLASVHAATQAFLKDTQAHDTDLKMIMFWDNEEVGSSSSQGANSPFFSDTLEKLLLILQIKREDHFAIINRSLCVSVDLAHALHPNHVDKHDSQHQVLLGKGIVIKYNAQQKYATTANAAAMIQYIAQKAHIPLQKFVSRNDSPCGSTIGPIHASRNGMSTIDIGCPQLSMHACREVLACQDQLTMQTLLENILNCEEWPTIQFARNT